MKKIFLVDTENVNIDAIKGCTFLDPEDEVILFLSTTTDNNTFNSKNLSALGYKSEFKKIHIISGSKNSLDFQLVSYLGYLIGLNNKECSKYYIVSRDIGYLPAINLLNSCTHQKIILTTSIDNVVTKPNEMTPEKTLYNNIRNRGYQNKTAVKIIEAINRSSDFEGAYVNILNAFSQNRTIANNCKDIIIDYFK